MREKGEGEKEGTEIRERGRREREAVLRNRKTLQMTTNHLREDIISSSP